MDYNLRLFLVKKININFGNSDYIMVNTEKNQDWVYYVLGLLTGMLIVISITSSFLWILIGGILGLIFGGTFLSKIVKRD